MTVLSSITECCHILVLCNFRFFLLYLTLLTIGVGSWLFHMTLRYDMQLMDEVPMVFGSATLIYCIYQVQTQKHNGRIELAFVRCWNVSDQTTKRSVERAPRLLPTRLLHDLPRRLPGTCKAHFFILPIVQPCPKFAIQLAFK